ncbi:MAG: BatA domain-containing protein, partial [Candidatus Edwardsbacteria bacterium]|nr:BatA domain-containing protein [Candidatus Edwardsbacteria bacterium]
YFLPLTAIPVIIHLFRRRRAATTPFPDIRFLKESQTASWRRNRIRDWLLLALRVLTVLLLVLALARPRINAALPRWLGGSEGAVIILLDDSASMGARDGDSTLFDRAKAKATDILDRMSGNGRAAVVSAAQGSRVVCGFADPARARSRVRELEVTDRGTDIPAALAVAGQIASQAGRNASVVLISDLQRSGFGSLSPLPALPVLSALPSGAVLRVADVSAGRPMSNLIWDKVRASALRQRIIAEGRIAGGRQPIIRLERNGRIHYAQPAKPDDRGLFTVSFGWPDADSLTLTCSDDDLPLDNVYFLPGRQRRSTILLVADSAGSEHAAKALAAMAEYGFDLIRSDNPVMDQWERADAVVFCKQRVPEGMARRLLERLDAGARLLAIPPLSADMPSYNQYLLPRACRGELLSLAKADTGALAFRLTTGPGADPLGAGINSRAIGAAEVGAYWRARAQGSRALQVKGQPALVIQERSALWLFGAEPGMNTLIFKPAFIVLLHRALAQLLEGGQGQLHVGDAVKAAPGTELAGPGGKPVARDAEKGTWSLDRRGWFQKNSPERSMIMAANIPPQESDLDKISDAELKMVLQNNPWREPGTAATRASPLEALMLILVLAASSAELLVRMM